MLSIEYTHKHMKLFKIELSLLMVGALVAVILFWQIFSMLKIMK